MKTWLALAVAVVLASSGCAGGTIGTGVRKILPKRESAPKPKLIPSWLTSHTARCIVTHNISTGDETESETLELRVFPENLAESVETENGQCKITVIPEEETLQFELHGIQGESPAFSLEERDESGRSRIVSEGVFAPNSTDDELHTEFASRTFIRGRVYQLKIFDAHKSAPLFTTEIHIGSYQQ